VLARNGQVGVIEDLGGRYDVPFAASIRFDDGGQLWAYADELSPLPAAPTNEVDWRDDTIAARMVKDNGHHDPSAAAPLQEDTK
jgi:hypothetical protein